MKLLASKTSLSLILLSSLIACANPDDPARNPVVAVEHVDATIAVSGELTLKGSEYNAWFALRDDNGKLWRLESDDSDLLRQLRGWQNRRVRVVARVLPKTLVDRLKIVSIALE